MRLNLALTAVMAPESRGLSREEHEQRVRQRALVLRDLGIDPLLPPRETYERLLVLQRRLALEPGAVLRDQLNLASVLVEAGLKAEARALLERLRGEHPDSVEVRLVLRDLDGSAPR